MEMVEIIHGNLRAIQFDLAKNCLQRRKSISKPSTEIASCHRNIHPGHRHDEKNTRAWVQRADTAVGSRESESVSAAIAAIDVPVDDKEAS
jgi:hypothetical protein